MKKTAIIEILILASVTPLCGCNLVMTNTVLYQNVDFRSQKQRNQLPSKKSMEWLLTEIWNSGFLEKNELVEREILNNHYGVFDGDKDIVVIGDNADDRLRGVAF